METGHRSANKATGADAMDEKNHLAKVRVAGSPASLDLGIESL